MNVERILYNEKSVILIHYTPCLLYRRRALGTSPVNDQASAVSYLVQISYLGSIVLDIRIDGYVVYIIVDIKV